MKIYHKNGSYNYVEKMEHLSYMLHEEAHEKKYLYGSVKKKMAPNTAGWYYKDKFKIPKLNA